MKKPIFLILAPLLALIFLNTAVAQVAPFNERTRCNQPIWNAKYGIYLKMYRPSLKMQSDLLYDSMNGYSERAKLAENLLQIFDSIDAISGAVGIEKAADVTTGAMDVASFLNQSNDNDITRIATDQIIEWISLAVKPTKTNFLKFVVKNTAETATGLYGTIGIYTLIDEYRLISSANTVLFDYYRNCGDQEEIQDDLNLTRDFKNAEGSTDFLSWAVIENMGKGTYSSSERLMMQKELNQVLEGVNETYQLLSSSEVAAGTPDLEPYGLDTHPYDVSPGSRMQIEFGVNNEGKGTANPSVARLRMTTTPDEVTVNDPLLATVNVQAMDGDERSEFEETVTLPSDLSAGRYYIWLILDVNSEAGQRPADEANDKDYEELDIEYFTPDLESSRLNTTPSSARPGQEVKVAFEVENYADGAAKPSKARLRLSTSRKRITTQDPELATIEIPALAAGEELQVEKLVRLPSNISGGRYYIWVIVDVTSEAGQTFENEKNDKRYVSIRILE
jgi:hypothetical protein